MAEETFLPYFIWTLLAKSASKVQINYGKITYSAICVYFPFTNKSVKILTEFPISGREKKKNIPTTIQLIFILDISRRSVYNIKEQWKRTGMLWLKKLWKKYNGVKIGKI